MRQQEEPAIQTLNATQARRQWGRILDRVVGRETRVVIERLGMPVAALVSIEDLRALRRWEEQQARRFEALRRLREPFKDVPADEIEREVGKAIAEVREEHAPETSRRRA